MAPANQSKNKEDSMADKRPNILIICTDQMRHATAYDSEDLARFRREVLTAQQALLDSGVSFDLHYTMSAACTPSRASFLTGQYPSLHGVTQTDGLAKAADGGEMIWLASDTVPTLGDWFRAGGYRTFYKGKWHVSHAVLEAPDGSHLQTLDKDGNAIPGNIPAYLEADLLDPYGFSEWVGPEAHGFGPQNTGTVRDPFTADETIALLKRFDQEKGEKPWLAMCSLLNPHDIATFGIIAKTQGLDYETKGIPKILKSPTQDEDLSTKPACQQSYINAWGKILAPQPQIELQRRFYYQMHRKVDEQIARVMAALRESSEYENTIVVYTTDHGDMLGAHGGAHEKWHNAYQETIHIPFVVASPLFQGGRTISDFPTSHADLLPTLLGLAGIDHDEALKKVAADHTQARPLVGRDLTNLIRGTGEQPALEPVLFTTDDEISEGHAPPSSPFQRWARKLGVYEEIVQPNHIQCVVARIDVDGEQHLVKFTRYYDNPQYWTVPGVRDDRLQKRKEIVSVTEPSPDEFELYDLSVDPLEERNLAHPTIADDRSRRLQKRMHQILLDQLAAKRLVPTSGDVPGYRPLA
jgi:arylsulfatase A-like enzyme